MLSAVTGGFYAGATVKRRHAIIGECVAFVQFVASRISYADEPLERIICAAVENGSFKQLSFLNSVESGDFSQGFTAVWNNSVDMQRSLGKPVSVLLKSFGARLGKTNVNDQVELCSLYKKEFEQLWAAAEKSKNEKIKLYRIAGSAIGILMLIVFI